MSNSLTLFSLIGGVNMKIELYDKESTYAEVIEFAYSKTTLPEFVRLVNKGASAKKVVKAVLDKYNWAAVKRLKLTKKSYESLISVIATQEIFPKLEKLADLTGEFKIKYEEFAVLYSRDKKKLKEILAEYLDD